jgi:hypothetical protein
MRYQTGDSIYHTGYIRQQTVRQHIADSKQLPADGRQQRADSREQTADSKRQRADSRVSSHLRDFFGAFPMTAGRPGQSWMKLEKRGRGSGEIAGEVRKEYWYMYSSVADR